MVYMTIWKFKSCSRCGGDIFIDRDVDGWYEQCLQCGCTRDMPNTVKVYQHGKENRLVKRERSCSGSVSKATAVTDAVFGKIKVSHKT
jgi:hypothetical protein